MRFRPALPPSLSLWLSLSLLACGRPAERAEIDRVLRAIDALRDAPADALDARATLVDALAKEPATLPEAVAARDRCAAAYRPFVEGKRLAGRVKQSLADPKNASPTLLADLADAEAKIKASADAMPACDSARADLARRGRP